MYMYKTYYYYCYYYYYYYIYIYIYTHTYLYIHTGRATVQVHANGAPMRQRGCARSCIARPNYCIETRKSVVVMYLHAALVL